MGGEVGRGGMGSHKHGVSGRPGKSPKERHRLRREAEKAERRAKPTTTEWTGTVADALRPKPKT